MVSLQSFFFYNNIDSFWRPFPLKFLGKKSKKREKHHHHAISMVWPLIGHSSQPIRVRKLAQLLKKKKHDLRGKED